LQALLRVYEIMAFRYVTIRPVFCSRIIFCDVAIGLICEYNGRLRNGIRWTPADLLKKFYISFGIYEALLLLFTKSYDLNRQNGMDMFRNLFRYARYRNIPNLLLVTIMIGPIMSVNDNTTEKVFLPLRFIRRGFLTISDLTALKRQNIAMCHIKPCSSWSVLICLVKSNDRQLQYRMSTPNTGSSNGSCDIVFSHSYLS
jgi:hypothetical protein